MYIDEMDSCCSVRILKNLWGAVTAAQIRRELLNCITEYDTGNGTIEKEYPRFFMATTLDSEQSQAVAALKEMGFKPRKFYGRHQTNFKRQTKYMTLWILDHVPKDILTEARALAKANKQPKYRRRW